MFRFLKCFAKSDDGAVTVDWVVLTAAVIGLGLAVIIPVGRAATDAGGGVQAAVADVEPSDASIFD